VFRLNHPDFGVIVCDNGSTDSSFEKIKQWAKGELPAEPANLHLKLPPCPKPIPYLELTRTQAEQRTAVQSIPLTLIQNGANLGFAGGNNVGLRYALRDPNSQFFWLLNNDTSPAPDALSALVSKAMTDRRIGAVASICYYAGAPSTVQVWAGGRVNLWIGRSQNSIEPRADSWFQILNGASMLITRAALEDTGLLDEGFFLYWEETEFCLRLRKRGWRLAAAPDSQVLHKVNASTGGNREIIDRYFTASGLRLLRLHSAMPHLAMSLFLIGRMARRLLRFRFSNCKSVWAGIQDYRQMLPVIPRIL
jgi:GT2 family glycosyltransferase